jgi:hypothetical protein
MFEDYSRATAAEVLEDSMVGNAFSYRGEPTRICMITAARTACGMAAIYEWDCRESNC